MELFIQINVLFNSGLFEMAKLWVPNKGSQNPYGFMMELQGV